MDNTATDPAAGGERPSFPLTHGAPPGEVLDLTPDDAAGRSHFFTVVDAAWDDYGKQKVLVLTLRSDEGLVERVTVSRYFFPGSTTPETILGLRVKL
jgi:hypothetical protein